MRDCGAWIVLLLSLGVCTGASAQQPARDRLEVRRKGPHVICHRGASEFAHENTLEAFRATFELGGDGNEIDIRSTKDDVLVCFHDDMLDRILEAYGDVSDYTWEELQQFRFRNSGRFGDQCRIPTLTEAFELHRKYGGLMHLDIKRPNLDQAIADLLTKLEMWDQVAYCNQETGGVILKDPRYKPSRYKGQLYQDRSEVFPEPIAVMLEKPGDGIIVDDPRGAVVALGRKLGKVSTNPVAPRTVGGRGSRRADEQGLLAVLRDDADWDRIAESDQDRRASSERIRARARAADQLLAIKASSPDALAALENRVRRRSLHKEWMYHGLDGEKSLRTLLLLKSPGAVDLARFVLWSDDPALDQVADPRFENPRAWTDFRVKTAVFPALAHCPGEPSEKLCRDYLALSDDEASKLGPLQFEQAAHALLAISPKMETALEFMQHRLRVVRGRAILDCLARANEPWARTALGRGAKHALAYLPP